MKAIFRVGSIAACLFAVIPFTNGAMGASSVSDVYGQSTQGHLSSLVARITMHSGATRMVKLEGVGCSQSICSRTAIKAKTASDTLVRTWFDSLAGIKDTTARDALFVLKDGTSHRMSLINDFRVLYLANQLGRTERLDLATVKSVEFLTPPSSN